MYGVSKINIEPSLMMISVQDVEFKGNSLARYLQIFADNGVVVDMISQSAPHGTTIDFSFTAAGSDLPLVMKAISAANLDKDAKASPLISVGYSKLNLFGEDMVTSCGVAARALNALAMAGIEVLLITTSDLDISLLVHAENEDAAYETLKKAYELLVSRSSDSCGRWNRSRHSGMEPLDHGRQHAVRASAGRADWSGCGRCCLSGL